MTAAVTALCKELIPAVLERTKRLGILNDGNSAKHGDCCAYERVSIHDEAAAVHEGDSRLVDNYVALGVRLDYLIHLQELPERRNEPQEAVKYGKRESQEQKALRLCVDYFYKVVFLGHFSDELTGCRDDRGGGKTKGEIVKWLSYL